MKRVVIFLIILTFFGFAPQKAISQGVKKIVIDAGHGGKDPGALGPNGIKEKNIVLAIALKTGKYIEDNFPDVEVVYTRNTDVFIELYERANIANKSDADLFISIHANSSSSTEAHGAETYALGLHKTEANLEVAKRENAVIDLEDNADKNYSFDPNSPEGHIMMSIAQNAFLDQSLLLASNVQVQFTERVKRYDRGVRQAGFFVLYKTKMPSVLIELGFVSNPEEAAFLNSVTGQDYMASAIYRAVKDYKQHVDALWAENQKVKVEQVEQQKVEADKEGRIYKIQVYASKYAAKKDAQVYKDFEKVWVEQANNGVYRHVVNEYNSYEAASADLLNVVKKGYKGAYIVAYKDGKRVQVYDITTTN